MGDTINDQYWGVDAINAQYWGIHGGEKRRVRANGLTPKGSLWYVVEAKPVADPDARWTWYLCGTSEWLNLSAQSCAWAMKTGERR